MKIAKSTKYGGSVVLPLTGFIEPDKEYLIREDDGKVIIELAEKVIRK